MYNKIFNLFSYLFNNNLEKEAINVFGLIKLSSEKISRKKLIEKYNKVKALRDGATTDGERNAAQNAMDNLEKTYPQINFNQPPEPKGPNAVSFDDEELWSYPQDLKSKVEWVLKKVESEGINEAFFKKYVFDTIRDRNLRSNSDLERFVRETEEGQELMYTEPAMYEAIKERLSHAPDQERLEERYKRKVREYLRNERLSGGDTLFLGDERQSDKNNLSVLDSSDQRDLMEEAFNELLEENRRESIIEKLDRERAIEEPGYDPGPAGSISLFDLLSFMSEEELLDLSADIKSSMIIAFNRYIKPVELYIEMSEYGDAEKLKKLKTLLDLDYSELLKNIYADYENDNEFLKEQYKQYKKDDNLEYFSELFLSYIPLLNESFLLDDIIEYYDEKRKDSDKGSLAKRLNDKKEEIKGMIEKANKENNSDKKEVILSAIKKEIGIYEHLLSAMTRLN